MRCGTLYAAYEETPLIEAAVTATPVKQPRCALSAPVRRSFSFYSVHLELFLWRSAGATTPLLSSAFLRTLGGAGHGHSASAQGVQNCRPVMPRAPAGQGSSNVAQPALQLHS